MVNETAVSVSLHKTWFMKLLSTCLLTRHDLPLDRTCFMKLLSICPLTRYGQWNCHLFGLKWNCCRQFSFSMIWQLAFWQDMICPWTRHDLWNCYQFAIWQVMVNETAVYLPLWKDTIFETAVNLSFHKTGLINLSPICPLTIHG